MRTPSALVDANLSQRDCVNRFGVRGSLPVEQPVRAAQSRLVPMGHRHGGAEQMPTGGYSSPQRGKIYIERYLYIYICMYIYIYIYIYIDSLVPMGHRHGGAEQVSNGSHSSPQRGKIYREREICI